MISTQKQYRVPVCEVVGKSRPNRQIILYKSHTTCPFQFFVHNCLFIDIYTADTPLFLRTASVFLSTSTDNLSPSLSSSDMAETLSDYIQRGTGRPWEFIPLKLGAPTVPNPPTIGGSVRVVRLPAQSGGTFTGVPLVRILLSWLNMYGLTSHFLQAVPVRSAEAPAITVPVRFVYPCFHYVALANFLHPPRPISHRQGQRRCQVTSPDLLLRHPVLPHLQAQRQQPRLVQHHSEQTGHILSRLLG